MEKEKTLKAGEFRFSTSFYTQGRIGKFAALQHAPRAAGGEDVLPCPLVLCIIEDYAITLYNLEYPYPFTSASMGCPCLQRGHSLGLWLA